MYALLFFPSSASTVLWAYVTDVRLNAHLQRHSGNVMAFGQGSARLEDGAYYGVARAVAHTTVAATSATAPTDVTEPVLQLFAIDVCLHCVTFQSLV